MTMVKITSQVLLLLGCIVIVGCGPSINSSDPLERKKAAEKSSDNKRLAHAWLLDENDMVANVAFLRLVELEMKAEGVDMDKKGSQPEVIRAFANIEPKLFDIINGISDHIFH